MAVGRFDGGGSKAMAMTIGEFQDPHRAARQMVESRPVDLVHLARYTLGDRDMEREVLSLFANQCDRDIERLQSAQSQTDWQGAAHTIKGSARAIGAWKLARLAEEAEVLGLAQHDSRRGDAIVGIISAAREVKTFIKFLSAAK